MSHLLVFILFFLLFCGIKECLLRLCEFFLPLIIFSVFELGAAMGGVRKA